MNLDEKLVAPEGAQTCIYLPEKDSIQLQLIHSAKKSQSLPDSSLFPVCCFNANDVKYGAGTAPGLFLSAECIKERNVRDKHHSQIHHALGYGGPQRKQFLKLVSLSADWSFKSRFSLKNDYKCIPRRDSTHSQGGKYGCLD